MESTSEASTAEDPDSHQAAALAENSRMFTIHDSVYAICRTAEQSSQ